MFQADTYFCFMSNAMCGTLFSYPDRLVLVLLMKKTSVNVMQSYNYMNNFLFMNRNASITFVQFNHVTQNALKLINASILKLTIVS